MLKTLIRKTTFIALVGSISFAAQAIAGTQKIEVPAGDLITALESLAKQADVDLVYQDKQVKGLRTAGVSGNFSAQEALVKLLEGTSLKIRTDKVSGAILITPLATSGARRDAASALHLVQSETESVQRGESSSEEDTDNPSSKGIPEILVKGSRSLNTDIERTEDDPQPYVVFDSEEIQRSQAVNVEDFLRTRLPMNTTSTSNGQYTAAPSLRQPSICVAWGRTRH